MVQPYEPRAYWDSQCKFSEVLPDFADQLARMVAESERFDSGGDVETVRYGDHDRQWFELIEGDGNGDQTIVFIHGGYWRALEAENHRFFLGSLLPLANSIANLEYRLMPEVRLGDVVADVRDGLRALIESSPSSRHVLVGHSAGAHLAVSAADDPAIAPFLDGVIALSGVYDVGVAASSFIQDELDITADEIADHSVGPSVDRPSVLYVNGDAETPEFLRASATMAATGSVGWVLLDGADHMSLLWAAAEAMPELLTALHELGQP